MLDLSELLKTQYNEFVDLLLKTQYNEFVDILKTKFCHLRAIAEHERLVGSVATICDKKNAIANIKAGGKVGNKCEQDDREPETKCERDDGKHETNCNRNDSFYNDREQDDCKPLLNCDRNTTVERGCNECEQDDRKSELDCGRDGFVDNECGQDDGKPETGCDEFDTLENECEQDDCKLLAGCDQDVTKFELKEGDSKTVPIKDRLTEILRNGCTTFSKLLENNEKFHQLLRSQD